MQTVHKSITQNSQSITSTLKIDRVLSRSETEAFHLQNTSLLANRTILQSPTSQVLSSHSEAGSFESVHVEVEIEEIDDEIELIEQNLNDNPQEIESDSDMEIQVISEPEPVVPKPMPYLRVQPSKRFLQNLAKKNKRLRGVNKPTSVNKRDIAEKLKKINRQLSLRNKMMSTS